MTATRQIVLAGYRNLIRAARTTFRGDTHALKAARVELRTQFEDGRDCPGGDDEVQERVQAIHDERESAVALVRSALTSYDRGDIDPIQVVREAIDETN